MPVALHMHKPVASSARALRLHSGFVARRTLVVSHSAAGESAAPSTSGREELSCGGGGGSGQGFGTLRKGFKPQDRKAQKTRAAPAMNGRDKSEVLRSTAAEVAAKLRAAPSPASAAAAAPAPAAAAADEDPWADWKRVDAKVNTYPCERLFTAVGAGTDDFRDCMVRAVQEVVSAGAAEPVAVPVEVKPSSGGNYWSVRVGPVQVQHRDQVIEIFNRMRLDKRLKFHL
ncbi:hypothetical protein HYH03_001633 [Edaphochlamys debaryana]|uniref:Uncharacterized protein n=1 Tax=Edaphochlamys debaryana TaxID=47281 RepID=A0A835YFN7_9CHLO|nr:hypothetical protein HYH03_001633 [Edaphochlamys debaryana]|eukprot:KAG2500872.1 hypothetical protein HYH03_001633 [Edaphochlamys debaryana]